jgi:hypothetical protein
MKIELPIDTSTVSFIDVMPSKAVLDHKIKVTGLMVTDWAMGDRFGLTFRAAKVEAGLAAGQKAGAA